MDAILVTGGAGYIGAHACKALGRAGYRPVCFDNLATGARQAVRFGPFEQGDLLDRARLDAVFAAHAPRAVMHFAAASDVAESMRDPGKYWRINVQGTLNLIEAAIGAGCLDFVFSSTCAVYGDQDGVVLDEDSPARPINAYGASKRAIEQMLGQFAVSHRLRHVIFRYFNVAGADPEAEIGESHDPETHLVPLLLHAIQGRRAGLTIHGTDYDTPDGTCIRDYVHVADLVDAHVLGLRWLAAGNPDRVFNLGTGTGYSVRQVAQHSARVTNRTVPVTDGPRRPGDATALVCGGQRARDELGWDPRRSTLDTMIADAWRWHDSAMYGA